MKEQSFKELQHRIGELDAAGALLQKSEKVFRHLSDYSPNMIFINQKGRLVYVNQSCVKVMGYSREEFYAADFDFMTLIAPEYHDLIRSSYAKHMQGEDLKPYEYEIITKNNERINVIITTKLIEYEHDRAILGIITDITDLKNTEHALKESEVKYRNLVENISEVIYTIDSDGNISYISPSIERVMGYTQDEVIGKNFEMFIYPEDSSRTMDQFRAGLSGKDVGNEFRIVTKDAQIIWIMTSTKPLYEEEHIKGVQGVFLDISDRKRAEQVTSMLYEMLEAVNVSPDLDSLYSQIHKSLGTIIDTTNLYIALYDQEKDIISFTYFSDEMDSDPEILNAKDSRSMTAVVINSNKPLLISRKELERKFSLGEMKQWGSIPEIWLGVPLRIDGKVIGVIAVQSYTDPRLYTEQDIKLLESVSDTIAVVIQKKKADNVILESERKYKELANLLPEIIFEVDNAGNFIFVNQEAFVTFGYSQEEFDQGMNVLQVFIEEDHERLISYREEVLSSDKQQSIELTALRKNGTKFPVVVYANPVIQVGIPVGIRGIVIDLTERKQTEEEKKRIVEQCNQALRMESLGWLAGAVAHDLNHILTGLVTYPDLLLMNIDEDNPLKKSIEKIKQSGLRAAAVVEDLQYLSRGSILAREPVNINRIIEECIHSPEISHIREQHRGIAIKTSFESEVEQVLSTNIHIMKILNNLIMNAVEAMPSGGILLLSTENVVLGRPVRGFETINPGRYVRLRVSDTGVGISKEDISQIFEPYFTKKVYAKVRSGIGLTIVWNIVKENEGFIDVKSEIGQGTVFNIYFPVYSEKPKIVDASYGMKDYMGNGETILIVDDDENVRSLGVVVLESLQYKPVAAESGLEAIEYIRNNETDLVLLDMILGPGIDGLTTLEELKKISPDQKVIIVSGFAESERTKAAQKLGAKEIIKKPFTIQELGLAIKRELNQ